MLSDYHKAVVGAIAGGIVAALGVVAGALSGDQTFADVSTQTWLFAVIAFITGAGLTGGTVAVSKANTRSKDIAAVGGYVVEHRGEQTDDAG
jgi:hypothetical protein